MRLKSEFDGGLPSSDPPFWITILCILLFAPAVLFGWACGIWQALKYGLGVRGKVRAIIDVFHGRYLGWK